MNTVNLKNKRFIFFRANFSAAGGAERLMLEEAKYVEKSGAKAYILACGFKKDALFDGTYKTEVKTINKEIYSNIFTRFIHRILTLRKKIKEINPDIIISQTSPDCIYLYFATLFTPYSYASHIHETVLWFTGKLWPHALIYKKAFIEIRPSTAGHEEFMPLRPPKSSLIERMIAEFYAIAEYIAVRKAKRLFVLSNQMKWEVEKLYGKEAVVVKGALPPHIFNYKPRQNIKQQLGLANRRMVLNLNRLDPKKRVGLLIKAFKQICEKFGDVVLVIGGSGPEEVKLRNLAKELHLEDKVKFIGYVADGELWDYYACCDVFVHPNWADFAIAPYEALALQKKVVWSTEMEVDEFLAGNKHIFAANPTVSEFAKAIEEALITDILEKNDLSNYTWDKYCDRIIKELESV